MQKVVPTKNKLLSRGMFNYEFFIICLYYIILLCLLLYIINFMCCIYVGWYILVRKRGEKAPFILIKNLPGDTTVDDIKQLFDNLGQCYVDLRSDHGRQAKNNDVAWTRTCHASIRFDEVSSAILAKKQYDGHIMKHGNKIKISIKNLYGMI